MDSSQAFLADLRQTHLRHAQTTEQVRGLHVPYHRRGVLSIPAFKMAAGGDPAVEGRSQSLKLMAGAKRFAVDSLFFDLEDAAPDQPEFKLFAREFAIEALLSTPMPDRVIGFRPNNLRTEYFEKDFAQVLLRAGHRLDYVVLPKSESADEVADVARLLRQALRLAGVDRPVWLEVLIESPRAFAQAQRIAAIPEVSALVYGAYDFARCVGAQVRPELWLDDHRTVRQLLPVLAAAEGKEALDAVTAAIPLRPTKPAAWTDLQFQQALSGQDISLGSVGEDFVQAQKRRQRALDLTLRDAQDARALGFAGKWVLHPDQIAPIQGAWLPSRAQALRDLAVVASYALAGHGGSGAEVAGHQMADKAVIGALWWDVQAALRGQVLQLADIEATGTTLDMLQRAVVTRSQQLR